MKPILSLVFLATLSTSAIATTATEVQAPAAAQQNHTISNIQYSPSGKFVSQVVTKDNKKVLIVLDAADKSFVHVINFKANEQIGNYAWANDFRLVFEKVYTKDWSDTPFYYGQLYAINADGTNSVALIGYNTDVDINTKVKMHSRVRSSEPLQATSFILDPLVNNEDKILVRSIPWGNADKVDFTKSQDIYEIDIYKGLRKKIMTVEPTTPLAIVEASDGQFNISKSNITNLTDYQISKSIAVVVTTPANPRFIQNGKSFTANNSQD
ncbi:hypothetical protein [Shewanella donghaensis]|uniref:hypothetical protein n=1 Tax=Shewanella donghaensis TaxID=238836 RepID=UPI001183C6C5|nr:hypothetical protein [Shewanella donghaensis]